MKQQRLGIIGGTGLYAIDDLHIEEKRTISTPFGEASAPLTLGRWGKREVVFLPRHGEGHSLLPSEINYRANVYALKAAGATEVVAVSATGSLQQEVAPGELALVSQYVDWTKGRREHTFFGEGLVAHISSANPSCPILAQQLSRAAEKAGIKIHRDKTYACVEGPRLGTRAESFLLKQLNCDLVGMTNVPEAFLAREAQLAYCTMAVVTDYDCWKENPEEHVSVEKVIALYRENLSRVIAILRSLCSEPRISEPSLAWSALAAAVLTPESSLSPQNKDLLHFLRA